MMDRSRPLKAMECEVWLSAASTLITLLTLDPVLLNSGESKGSLGEANQPHLRTSVAWRVRLGSHQGVELVLSQCPLFLCSFVMIRNHAIDGPGPAFQAQCTTTWRFSYPSVGAAIHSAFDSYGMVKECIQSLSCGMA